MKLIYIHQHFVTRSGYSGTRSYEFSRYLVQKGNHCVYLLCGNNRKSNFKLEDNQHSIEMNLDGIKLKILNIPYEQKMNFWNRIKSFFQFSFEATLAGLKQKSIDAVFATSTPITVGIPGFLISKIRRVPFIFEVRDIWPESAVAIGTLTNPILIKLTELFERLIYYSSERIVVISDRMKQRIVRERNIDQNKISVIHIGADLDLFGKRKDAGFRKRYDLEGKFVAIFAGAHGKANGLKLLVDTSKLLPDRFKIVLIGEGGEKSHLIEYAQRIETDKILFLDPVPKLKLAGIMNEVDCCCMVLKRLPIFDTACPNKFFDYLASGKPIITNFSGEISSMLEEYNAGILVKDNSAKSFSEALIFLSEHYERCDEMGRNARKLSELFNRTKMAKKFEAMLLKVINSN